MSTNLITKPVTVSKWLNDSPHSLSIYKSNEQGNYLGHVNPYQGRDSKLNPIFHLNDGIYRCNKNYEYAWLITVSNDQVTNQRELFAHEG